MVGRERVVSYITEALVDLGHDVTLFASGDSQTRGKLEAVWPRALRLDPGIRDRIAPHMLLMERVRRMADQFDVLHFHMDYYSFSLFGRQDTPFITTLHGRLDLPNSSRCSTCSAMPRSCRSPTASAIRCRRPSGSRPSITALPDQLYTPQPVEQKYLAFLAGFRPRSGSTPRSVSRQVWDEDPDRGARRRSTRPIASISKTRSSRCSICRTSNTSARSPTRTRRCSCPARTRCCFRSTGRSRLAS